MLGSGNSFPQTPKTPRSGEKARTRRVARWILEEPLGASRRRRQADWSPLAPRLGAAGLAQCSCSQLASARTKGLPGAADRVRLGARGRKGLSGESASSEGLGWPPPATARGPASCQGKTEESQSPLTPSGRMAAVRLGIPHTHPPSRKPKGLALGNNHQKSLCGPFSQPMSDPAMVWDNRPLLQSPLGSTNPGKERKGRLGLRSAHMVKTGADSLTWLGGPAAGA